MEMFLIFLGCGLIVSAVIYRFTFGLRKATGQTRKTQIVMLMLLGSGLLLIGLIQVADILFSKPRTIAGFVTHLRKTSGKNAESIFWVTDAAGNVVQLTAAYEGERLVEGVTVRATYLDRTASVTQLEVRDGVGRGWSETESPWSFQIFLAVTAGPALLALGLSIWRKKPRASQASVASQN